MVHLKIKGSEKQNVSLKIQFVITKRTNLKCA